MPALPIVQGERQHITIKRNPGSTRGPMGRYTSVVDQIPSESRAGSLRSRKSSPAMYLNCKTNSTNSLLMCRVTLCFRDLRTIFEQRMYPDVGADPANRAAVEGRSSL